MSQKEISKMADAIVSQSELRQDSLSPGVFRKLQMEQAVKELK